MKDGANINNNFKNMSFINKINEFNYDKELN